MSDGTALFLFLLSAGVVALFYFKDPTEADILEELDKLEDVSHESAVWAHTRGAFGGYQRTALFYGKVNDMEECELYLDALTRRYGYGSGMCVPLVKD